MAAAADSERDLCKEIAAACGLEPTGTYPAVVRKLVASLRLLSRDETRRYVAHRCRPRRRQLRALRR